MPGNTLFHIIEAHTLVMGKAQKLWEWKNVKGKKKKHINKIKKKTRG